MKKSLVLDLVKLSGLLGLVWVAFMFIPIFPDEDAFEISVEKEEKLGELIIKNLIENQPDFVEIKDPVVDSAMYVMQQRLKQHVGLTDYDYKIRVISSEQINAFTLPGGNIFVYSGLIRFSERPEEVAAVLAHEIGHVEHKHVVEKLIKEFGLNILFSILTGGDAMVIGELSKTAVSAAFDRKNEEEADNYALQLLEKASVNPKALATFFKRLEREKGGYDEKLEMIMTHPHMNSRVKKSLEHSLPKNFESRKFDFNWDAVQSALNTGATPQL